MSLIGNANSIGKIPGIHFPTVPSGGLFGTIAQGAQSAYAPPTLGVPGTAMQGTNPRPSIPTTPNPYSLDPTQAAISAAGSGASSTGQGNDVFSSYYAGDPTLQNELNAIQQQKDMLGTNYQTQAEQAAINYGSIPDLSKAGITDTTGLLAGALADSATQQNAANNPYSTTAQLQQQLTQANNTADANLVARGIYRSGELGQDHTLNNTSYDTASNSALQSFLSALGGYTSDYNTGLNGLGGQLSGYYGDATNRAIALINAGLLGNPPASAGGGSGDASSTGGGLLGNILSGAGGSQGPLTPSTPVYGITPGAGQGDVGSGIAGLGGGAGGTYVPPPAPKPVAAPHPLTGGGRGHLL